LNAISRLLYSRQNPDKMMPIIKCVECNKRYLESRVWYRLDLPDQEWDAWCCEFCKDTDEYYSDVEVFEELTNPDWTGCNCGQWCDPKDMCEHGCPTDYNFGCYMCEALCQVCNRPGTECKDCDDCGATFKTCDDDKYCAECRFVKCTGCNESVVRNEVCEHGIDGRCNCDCDPCKICEEKWKTSKN